MPGTLYSTYDELGRALTRTYPDGGIEGFSYNERGLAFATNQLGLLSAFAYDEAGRKTAETNANNEVVSYAYNADGGLHTLTDGKNQTTTWEYDEYCRVTNKIDAATNTVFRYTYDAGGRLQTRWTPEKGATAYAYDAAGGLTNVDYAASADLSMAYDALGRMTNMVDGVGTTRYAYTSAGRLESEDGPWDNDTVSYSHFQNGLRASVSLPAAGAAAWRQTYAWDAGNRLTNITSGAGGFAYLYETTVGAAQTPAASLIDKILLPGGTAIFKAHDSVGRVVNTSLMDTSTNALNMHAYNYNLAGQRTKQTFTDGNYVDYTYDDIGQLKTAIGKETGGAGRLHEQMGYAYDAAGNLNVRTNNALVQTFNVNSRNELTTGSRSGTLTVAVKGS